MRQIRKFGARSTSPAELNIEASVLGAPNGRTRNTTEEISSMSSLISKIRKTRNLISLYLKILVSTELESATLLKDVRTLFGLKAIKNGQPKLNLDLTFCSEVKTASWAKLVVDLVWNKRKFHPLKLTWKENPRDIEEALEVLWTHGSVARQPGKLSPLTLEFHTATSAATGVIFKSLCYFLENIAWPLAGIIFNLKELKQGDIPDELKTSLGRQSEDMKLYFRSHGETEALIIQKETFRFLLATCALRTFLYLEGIYAEFDEEVLNEYFYPTIMQKKLVLKRQRTESLLTLGSSWELNAFKNLRNQMPIASLSSGNRQIIVFDTISKLKPLLVERPCEDIEIMNADFGFEALTEFLGVQNSTSLTIISDSSKDVLRVSKEEMTAKVPDTFMEVVTTLEKAIQSNRFLKLSEINFMLSTALATEEAHLRFATFKEDLEKMDFNIAVNICHHRVGRSTIRISPEDISVNKILEKKLFNANRSGEMLNYSRSKLVMLGPSGSGKTSTLRNIVNKDTDHAILPTTLVQNQWDATISNFNELTPTWEVVNVEHMKHGMSPDLQEMIKAITFNNSSTVFTANVAAANRRTSSVSKKSKQFSPTKFKTLRPDSESPALVLGYSKLSTWDTSGSENILIDQLMHPRGIYALVFSQNVFLNDSNLFASEVKSWAQYVDSNASDSYIVIIITNSKAGETEQVLQDMNLLIHEVLESCILQNVVIAPNPTKDLIFFPVDNENYSEEVFSLLRGGISKCLLLSTSNIPVSWICFMDIIFNSNRVFITLEELEETAASTGFFLTDVPAMVSKYAEMGALLSVQHKNSSKIHSNVIVLRPQIFIESLEIAIEAAVVSGVQSAEAMQEAIEKYFIQHETRFRFWKYCEDALICSRLHVRIGDNISTFLPFNNSEQVLAEFNPKPKEQCWSVFIAWEGSPPKSFYERFLTLLINSNANMSATNIPEIFETGARFRLRGVEVFVIKQESEIELRVSREFGEQYKIMAESLELLCDEMENRGLTRASVVVETIWPRFMTGSELFKTTWKNVKKVFNESDVVSVQAFGANFLLPTSTLINYKIMFSTEAEHLSELKSNSDELDVCIIHDWGSFDDVSTHHDHVLEIASGLRKSNLKVWVDEGFNGFDESFVKDPISKATLVVVFLTESFIQKLRNTESSAAVEIVAALGKGVESVLPFALDTKSSFKEDWESSVFGYLFWKTGIDELRDFSKMSVDVIVQLLEVVIHLRTQALAIMDVCRKMTI